MAKNKGSRVIITLRCTECKENNNGNSLRKKKVDYTTTKNRRNTPNRLEVKKFCPKCNSHTYHKEIK